MNRRRLIGVFLLFTLSADPCSYAYVQRLWAKKPGSASKLFAFEHNGKVGFIDPTGRVVIKPTIPASIDDVGDFSHGKARIGGRGYVDEAGVWTRKNIPSSETDDFSEGLASFAAEGKRGIRKFEPGNFVYRDFPGLKGFLDRSGKVIIQPTFADVGQFVNGLAWAALDGYCHLAKPDGDQQGSPTSGYPSSCGGAPADAFTPCKVGFINTSGTFAIEPKFESAQDFHEGLAAVRLGWRWGFINHDGIFVIPPQFQQTRSFQEGLAAVKIDDKWGFIETAGTVVIPPHFDQVEGFSDSLAIAYEHERPFYIDSNGKVAINGPFLEATPFVHGLAAVRRSGEDQVEYINHAGRTVFKYTRRHRTSRLEPNR